MQKKIVNLSLRVPFISANLRVPFGHKVVILNLNRDVT